MDVTGALGLRYPVRRGAGEERADTGGRQLEGGGLALVDTSAPATIPYREHQRARPCENADTVENRERLRREGHPVQLLRLHALRGPRPDAAFKVHLRPGRAADLAHTGGAEHSEEQSELDRLVRSRGVHRPHRVADPAVRKTRVVMNNRLDHRRQLLELLRRVVGSVSVHHRPPHNTVQMLAHHIAGGAAAVPVREDDLAQIDERDRVDGLGYPTDMSSDERTRMKGTQLSSRQIEPREGDLVVARIENEITLERFHRASENLVELQPQSNNPEHETIRIGPQSTNTEIAGVVVGAIIGTRIEGSATPRRRELAPKAERRSDALGRDEDRGERTTSMGGMEMEW